MVVYTPRYVVGRRGLYHTLMLIYDYYMDTGRVTFHYRQLRAYWDRRRGWEYSEWHTIERVVRELAHDKLLERAGRGVFKITPELIGLAKRVRNYLKRAGGGRHG